MSRLNSFTSFLRMQESRATMEDSFYFTYLMASRPQRAIYLGYTSDIWMRVAEHKRGEGSRHSKKYNCKQLVWWEWFDDEHSAFTRERQMKKWVRQFKVNVIEELNPNWLDLSIDLTEEDVFNPLRRGPDNYQW